MSSATTTDTYRTLEEKVEWLTALRRSLPNHHPNLSIIDKALLPGTLLVRQQTSPTLSVALLETKRQEFALEYAIVRSSLAG